MTRWPRLRMLVALYLGAALAMLIFGIATGMATPAAAQAEMFPFADAVPYSAGPVELPTCISPATAYVLGIAVFVLLIEIALDAFRTR